MANNLDNPYSQLVNLIREQGTRGNSPDLMLAEVLTPYPEITVKAGDIQLDKDNLFIADYLLPNYKRAYYIEGVMHFEASGSNLSGDAKDSSIPSADVGNHGSHSHGTHKHDLNQVSVTTSKNGFYAHGDGDNPSVNDGTASQSYFYYKDTLKKGDLVALQQFPGTNKFLIYCKVVSLAEQEVL